MLCWKKCNLFHLCGWTLQGASNPTSTFTKPALKRFCVCLRIRILLIWKWVANPMPACIAINGMQTGHWIATAQVEFIHQGVCDASEWRKRSKYENISEDFVWRGL